MINNSAVYQHPAYYALGYRLNTKAECAFIESCLKTHGPAGAKRLLDIGCGSGRHLLSLVAHGFEMTGIDIQPEMVEFVQRAAQQQQLAVTAKVDDLHRLELEGTFHGAYCFMDTFRCLLSNEAILKHLHRVGQLLAPGGLYLVDFWIPSQWSDVANEVHQWEQTEGDTTVKVFYVQHPESADPIDQTFEDELVFEVRRGDAMEEIRGGRTRTRLILPQEFRLMVAHSDAFDLIGQFSDFDVAKPLQVSARSWRMVSVLRRR